MEEATLKSNETGDLAAARSLLRSTAVGVMNTETHAGLRPSFEYDLDIRGGFDESRDGLGDREQLRRPAATDERGLDEFSDGLDDSRRDLDDSRSGLDEFEPEPGSDARERRACRGADPGGQERQRGSAACERRGSVTQTPMADRDAAGRGGARAVGRRRVRAS
jgi:hypothetical protein